MTSAVLESYATNDYQNRGGSYPKSEVPDAIYFNTPNVLEFSFKNTSEESASKFVERFASRLGCEILYLNAYQTGDYKDDWVDVTLKVKVEE